jgi:integrase
MLGPEADRGKEDEHIVPLIPAAETLIRRAIAIGPEHHELVFVSPKTMQGFDDSVPNRTLAKAFRTYRKNVRNGETGKFVSTQRDPILICPRFTIHDLRRTVGTGMARMGVDRLHISKTLGHKTMDRESTTGIIYDRHAYMAEKRAALTRWAARLAELEAPLIGATNVTVLPVRA